MNELTMILMASLAVIAISITFDYFIRRRKTAAPPSAGELRQTLDQILASTTRQEKALHLNGCILRDAHKKIHTVSKGLEKRRS